MQWVVCLHVMTIKNQLSTVRSISDQETFPRLTPISLYIDDIPITDNTESVQTYS